MFAGDLKMTLRRLRRQPLYALINVFGLALGMAAFLISVVLVQYELEHDHMFVDRDRIFTVSSLFAPESGEPIAEYPIVRTALGPVFAAEIPDARRIARTVLRHRVVSTSSGHFEVGIRFADPDFTRIFDFRYRHGDASAIDDAEGLMVTEATALRLFGRIDVVGERIWLDHEWPMQIAAVIETVAPDSHFNSSMIPHSELAAIAPMAALVGLGEMAIEGDWSALAPTDLTYVLLPRHLDAPWLEQRVNEIYQRHVPNDERTYINRLKVRPLSEANRVVWDSLRFPVLDAIRLLGLMVLLIACFNYSNLATAQSFGRTLEVGLRRTFGAYRHQLLAQFLTESLAVAAIAAVSALALMELTVPAYQAFSGRHFAIDYGQIVPLLALVAGLVGLVAGAYPAFIISRLSPSQSLRNAFLFSGRGRSFRGLMIAAQFSICIFMLASVLIIYSQNRQLVAAGDEFPRHEVVVLERMDEPRIVADREELLQRLQGLSGVRSVSLSSGVPFHKPGQKRTVANAQTGQPLELLFVSIDDHFMQTFDLELTAGRPLHTSVAGDRPGDDASRSHVIVNELAAARLGLESGAGALGQSFDRLADADHATRHEYVVVGVMPDQYFLGVHMGKLPLAFFIRPDAYDLLSVRLEHADREQTIEAIDALWAQSIEGYPIRRVELNAYFSQFFRIPEAINAVVAGFTVLALVMALIGLFGLAAFMAQRRIREIGLRKVVGARVSQVVRLLIWQFATPVVYSLLVAGPLAYMASRIYLDFFAEPITHSVPIILIASLVGLLTAWLTVAFQALRVARMAPMQSLRHS